MAADFTANYRANLRDSVLACAARVCTARSLVALVRQAYPHTRADPPACCFFLNSGGGGPLSLDTGGLTGPGYTANRGPLAMEFPMQLTAVYRKVSEGYVAFVEELPGANTHGASLEEARPNLVEAVDLVLDANLTLRRINSGPDVIREPHVIAAQ